MKYVDLYGKDLITTQDWEKEELDATLEVANYLKAQRYAGSLPELLRQKTFFALFYYPSTRTRTSFEAAATLLGGHAQYIEARTTRMEHGEAIKDVARVFSRYGNGIGIRIGTELEIFPYGRATSILREFAKYASVPVINLANDMFHPCQSLTDIMTVKEKFQRIRGKKYVIMWGYSGGRIRTWSVIHGDALIMTRYGLDVELVHPPGFEIYPEIAELCKKNADENGGSFSVTNNYKETLNGAHIVFTRSWASNRCVMEGLENFGKNNELALHERYKDWMLNQELVDSMNRHGIIMHVMPVFRGHEATDEVMDSPRSVIIDQAENRLYTQMAVFVLTTKGKI